jgi:hypothetical protein
MGKSGGDGSATIQYAPYLQDNHAELIVAGWSFSGYGDNATTDILHQSPYAGIYPDDPTDAVLGVGVALSAFPSLYDMFGKFVAGLDIEALNTQIQNDMVTSPVITAAIAAENVALEDDINQNVLPKMRATLRDIGAVMTSSFMDAQALVEINKQKTLSRFSADIKMKAFEMAQGRWSKHLEWNQHTIDQYMNLIKIYFTLRFDYINAYGETASRDLLWPFTVLDHQRAFIAALNNAYAAGIAGDDKISKVIGGVAAVSGIASQVAGWVGSKGIPIGSVGGGYIDTGGAATGITSMGNTSAVGAASMVGPEESVVWGD